MQRFHVDPFREWLSLEHCISCGSRGRFKLDEMQQATASKPRQVVVKCVCGHERTAKPAAPARGRAFVTMTPHQWLGE